MASVELPKGIRVRGESYFVDVSYKGKRATATVPMATPDAIKAALAKKQELKAALILGKTPTAGKAKDSTTSTWTLKEAVETARRMRWAGTKAEKTMYLNSQCALDFFGPDTPLSEIDNNRVDTYVEYLKSTLFNSDGTINRKLSALRVAMKMAVARGGMEKVLKMDVRKEYEGRTRFLSEEEEARMLRILRHWGRDDEADLCTFLVDTGMRYGEATRITVQDVLQKKGERGVITVWINKGDKPRSVPMTSRVKEIVERRIALTKAQHDRLFPYPKDYLKRLWPKLKKAMGLPEEDQLVVHSLRHTCASRLVQRGVPLRVVQVWLGHKNITTTERYALLAPTSLLDAASVLE